MERLQDLRQELTYEIRREPVTSLLVIINILIFLAMEFTGGTENLTHMVKFGASYAPKIIENREYYRIFTSMFLHFGMTHLANNMLILFVLGGKLERSIGKIRFLIIYILGGLLGNILSLVLEVAHKEYNVSAGASGAVFAVIGALVFLVIRRRGQVEDLSRRQILTMAVFALYFGFTSSGVDNAAHVGGLLGGILISLCFPYSWKKY